MKKLLSTIAISFLCLAAFAQGSVPQYGIVYAGSTQNGISQTLGQSFYQHAPSAVSITRVAEGIQQAYAIDVKDTLLLLSDEMGTYTPGQNGVYTTSVEGYDSIIQRQVYELECPLAFDTTMEFWGLPTCNITLTGDYAARITPDEAVVVRSMVPGNPYDYPVGDTTVATWTASVAGQTKECHQNVIVRYFPCSTLPPVMDVDGYSYPVVNVGYYCWTGKNLRTVHNADMTDIPNVMTYPSEYAHGVSDMVATFGHLYTWDAAVSSAQGICPSGWHIPTQEEAAYLVSAFDARELMSNDSQIHWIPTDGTDDYDFTFLPAGYYNSSRERYEGLYVQAYFWTTETSGSEVAIACQFGSACGTSELLPARKDMGYSVRCVMNY